MPWNLIPLAFLRKYFDKFKYQSITTADFIDFFRTKYPKTAEKVEFKKWLHDTGKCPNLAPVDTSLVDEASRYATKWLNFFRDTKDDSGDVIMEKAIKLFSSWAKLFEEWEAKQKLCFLNELGAQIGEGSNLNEGIVWNCNCASTLGTLCKFDAMRNSEIRFSWCRIALQAKYEPIIKNVEIFVGIQGRMKFIRPLYNDLHKIYPKGSYAQKLYDSLKDGYHSIARKMIERDFSDGKEN